MCVPTHALPRDLGRKRARCVCSEFRARPVVKSSVSQSSLGAFPRLFGGGVPSERSHRQVLIKKIADLRSAALALAYCAQASMQQLVQSCLCAAVHSGKEHHKRSRRQPIFADSSAGILCCCFILLWEDVSLLRIPRRRSLCARLWLNPDL